MGNAGPREMAQDGDDVVGRQGSCSGAEAEGEETMTRSQWTAAVVFGGSILLVLTGWRLYAEGFTWRVAVVALMAVLLLAGQIGHSRKRSPQP